MGGTCTRGKPPISRARFSTWAECEQLLPQTNACVELINRWGFDFSEAARLRNQAGFYLTSVVVIPTPSPFTNGRW